jgi:hypothetical protein
MKNILFVILLTLTLGLVAQSQTFIVDDWVVSGATISNSGTATSGIFQLQTDGGLVPDSVYVIWDANGDSNNIELTVAKAFGSDISAYSLIGDTITVAQEMSYAKLAYTTYAAVTGLKIKYTALGSGNAVAAANKTKLYVKLRKFYTLN